MTKIKYKIGQTVYYYRDNHIRDFKIERIEIVDDGLFCDRVTGLSGKISINYFDKNSDKISEYNLYKTIEECKKAALEFCKECINYSIEELKEDK